MKDIVFLVADSNMKACIEGLIPKIQRVHNCRNFSFDILIHPKRDPGCRKNSVAFLSIFKRNYQKAFVLFDQDGSGISNDKISDVIESLERNFLQSGWEQDAAKVAIIYPELENWIWVKSNKMAQIINWESNEELRNFIIKDSFTFSENGKPHKPKEAFERALFISNKRRSSSIYKEIASTVSFKSCTDFAFLKLVECLKVWFTN